jgi:hypothetical protein
MKNFESCMVNRIQRARDDGNSRNVTRNVAAVSNHETKLRPRQPLNVEDVSRHVSSNGYYALKKQWSKILAYLMK